MVNKNEEKEGDDSLACAVSGHLLAGKPIPAMDSAQWKRRSLLFRLCGWWLTLVFALVISATCAIAAGLIAVLLRNPSLPLPIAVHSRCRILSSDVDIKSAKVCEIGLFNYGSQSLFNSVERTRFRCRYDYYWASIFKVEYSQHPSGQIHHAFAEVPKEALPLDCRPNFGFAWLTKDKFKVNETYNCKYTPGMSMVDIYTDDFFDCHSEEPSLLELMGRFFLLVAQSLDFYKDWRVSHMFLYLDAAAFLAAPSLVLLIRAIKTIYTATILVKRKLALQNLSISTVRLVRACFLVICFSALGWLSVQYGKVVDLPRFSISFSLRR